MPISIPYVFRIIPINHGFKDNVQFCCSCISLGKTACEQESASGDTILELNSKYKDIQDE